MARDDKKQWRCKECGTVTLETELLTAPSPFDAANILTACPVCKEVNDFYEVCDEPGCTREASRGFPAGPEFGGYRRTCFEHSHWSQALPDNAKLTGPASAGFVVLYTQAIRGINNGESHQTPYRLVR